MSITIPEGYRNSQLGIIPYDWEIKRLGELCSTFKSGFGITSIDITKAGKYPVYGGNGLRGFTKNFTHDGSYLLIGRQGALCGNIICINGKNYVSEHAIAIQTNPEHDLTFLAYKLNFLNLNRLSESSAQPGLSVEKLIKIKLSLPMLKEQQRISKLLNSIDNIIQTTSKLISKKELQKKALMQQLLTGKKRLKGFDEKWKLIAFKNCFQYIKSHPVSRDGLISNEFKEGIYCIHYGDIHAFYENEFLDFSTQKRIPQIINEKFKVKKSEYLKNGDIILADASEDYNGIGETVEVLNIDNKIAVGGLHTIVLRGINDHTLAGFRSYLFCSEIVRNTLRKKATGTSVYSITKTTLETLSFNLPSLKEQDAIANILKTADKEIQLLKTKADKLKEQKKGMMQLLLTGKKRLKLTDEIIEPISQHYQQSTS